MSAEPPRHGSRSTFQGATILADMSMAEVTGKSQYFPGREWLEEKVRQRATVGISAEWLADRDEEDHSVALLAFADAGTVLLLRTHVSGRWLPDIVKEALTSLLPKACVDRHEKLKTKLENSFALTLGCLMDIAERAAGDSDDIFNLQTLASLHGWEVDRSQRVAKSNWADATLTAQQVAHACDGAYFSYLLLEKYPEEEIQDEDAGSKEAQSSLAIKPGWAQEGVVRRSDGLYCTTCNAGPMVDSNIMEQHLTSSKHLKKVGKATEKAPALTSADASPVSSDPKSSTATPKGAQLLAQPLQPAPPQPQVSQVVNHGDWRTVMLSRGICSPPKAAAAFEIGQMAEVVAPMVLPFGTCPENYLVGASEGEVLFVKHVEDTWLWAETTKGEAGWIGTANVRKHRQDRSAPSAHLAPMTLPEAATAAPAVVGSDAPVIAATAATAAAYVVAGQAPPVAATAAQPRADSEVQPVVTPAPAAAVSMSAAPSAAGGPVGSAVAAAEFVADAAPKSLLSELESCATEVPSQPAAAVKEALEEAAKGGAAQFFIGDSDEEEVAFKPAPEDARQNQLELMQRGGLNGQVVEAEPTVARLEKGRQVRVKQKIPVPEEGPTEGYLYDVVVGGAVRILHLEDDWCWVETPERRQGWVPSSALEAIVPRKPVVVKREIGFRLSQEARQRLSDPNRTATIGPAVPTSQEGKENYAPPQLKLKPEVRQFLEFLDTFIETYQLDHKAVQALREAPMQSQAEAVDHCVHKNVLDFKKNRSEAFIHILRRVEEVENYPAYQQLPQTVWRSARGDRTWYIIEAMIANFCKRYSLDDRASEALAMAGSRLQREVFSCDLAQYGDQASPMIMNLLKKLLGFLPKAADLVPKSGVARWQAWEQSRQRVQAMSPEQIQEAVQAAEDADILKKLQMEKQSSAAMRAHAARGQQHAAYMQQRHAAAAPAQQAQAHSANGPAPTQERETPEVTPETGELADPPAEVLLKTGDNAFCKRQVDSIGEGYLTARFGESLTILHVEDEWTYVQSDAGAQGWFPLDALV
eukprot:TRINITY_DN80719_c0_g1_i1.p1 TRINITY_DN80719_c0_g1~~TRINITY_DN80719_c0_g1_i1.p1  ORF type:complete len:1038 (+),score=281.53 TRINITY_DN80719_c0_g1_i1:114-3227(+)